MEGPGTHAQLRHGRTQPRRAGRKRQALAGIIQPAVLAHFGRAHVRVAQQRHLAVRAAHSPGKPLSLYLTRPLDARTDVGAWFPQPVIGQLIVVHARHFDVDVYPTGRLRSVPRLGGTNR